MIMQRNVLASAVESLPVLGLLAVASFLPPPSNHPFLVARNVGRPFVSLTF